MFSLVGPGAWALGLGPPWDLLYPWMQAAVFVLDGGGLLHPWCCAVVRLRLSSSLVPDSALFVICASFSFLCAGRGQRDADQSAVGGALFDLYIFVPLCRCALYALCCAYIYISLCMCSCLWSVNFFFGAGPAGWSGFGVVHKVFQTCGLLVLFGIDFEFPVPL